LRVAFLVLGSSGAAGCRLSPGRVFRQRDPRVAAFDKAEFDRKVVVRLGDEAPHEVFVKSAEDTLLRKLLWYRLGGEVSDRGILNVQAERLDMAYLNDGADRLGVLDLLDRLLARE